MAEHDPTTEAVRAAREATAKLEQQLPADLEEAWAIWSRGIRNVDERGMTLLRAAFEAGWEAASQRGGSNGK